jgi:hypothetical protein
MGQTAISCTDRKRPGSLPELRLTKSVAVNAVKQKIMCIVCSVVLFVLCPF